MNGGTVGFAAEPATAGAASARAARRRVGRVRMALTIVAARLANCAGTARKQWAMSGRVGCGAIGTHPAHLPCPFPPMRSRRTSGIVDLEGGGFSPALYWVGGAVGTCPRWTRPRDSTAVRD